MQPGSHRVPAVPAQLLDTLQKPLASLQSTGDALTRGLLDVAEVLTAAGAELGGLFTEATGVLDAAEGSLAALCAPEDAASSTLQQTSMQFVRPFLPLLAWLFCLPTPQACCIALARAPTDHVIMYPLLLVPYPACPLLLASASSYCPTAPFC